MEEAIAEQDSAIEEMMSEALSAFEHLRSGDLGRVSSKADPKDGDFHGDPTRPITHEETFGQPPTGTGDEQLQRTRRRMGRARLSRMPKTATTAHPSTPSSKTYAGIDIDEMAFGMASDDGNETENAGAGDDPMSVLRRNPTVRNMVTVTFARDAFLQRLDTDGLDHPEETYRMFGAVMDVDGEGGLKPINADFDLADSRFSPVGSQEEPELADRQFNASTARVLGAQNSAGLAIQRVDLLQHGVNAFHDIARNTELDSVEKAQRAMQIIESISDPELTGLASQVTSALIDGNDTPDFAFTLADELDKERLRARDLLFSGQADQAIEMPKRLRPVWTRPLHGAWSARYFNSYAERVVYNRLFATLDERTVLIPDNLFYAHMELADVLGQLKGAKARFHT